jgi:hypothetical protein
VQNSTSNTKMGNTHDPKDVATIRSFAISWALVNDFPLIFIEHSSAAMSPPINGTLGS